MFFTYLRRELRRRSKAAIVVSLGLAVGIGLVMIVSATAAGVKTAQGQVLHSLYGVGTDLTVTKTATLGGSNRFDFRPGGSGFTRPAAGTHVSRNTLRPTLGQTTIPASDVATVASLHGVAAASGGLSLSDTSFSGTIPNFSSGGGFGGSSGSGGPANFNISSFSVDGVDVASGAIGPLASSQVTSGSYFTPADNEALVAVVSSSYASQQHLTIGSHIDVAGKSLSVIGLSSTPTSVADVFVPLGTAQKLSGLSGKITIVYASATSASAVSSVASAAKSALPGTTVTTSASLASEVSGSLASTSNLASNLGKWLSIAALIVAFLIAGLLMMAAVSRRVREFGTLKAIGWRTRRVVGQVMGEGVTLGLVGGVIGLVIGIAGAAIISAVAPTMTATVGSSFATGGGGFGGFGGGAPFGGGSSPFGGGASPFRTAASNAGNAAHTVLVHLKPSLPGGTIVIAIALAIAGGLIAGAFGSWRAARLRPADALRRVE